MSDSSILVSKKGLLASALLLVALMLAILFYSGTVADEEASTTADALPADQATPRAVAQPPATDSSAASGQGRSALPPHPQSRLLGTDQLAPEAQARLVGNILQIFRESTGAYPTAEDNPGVLRQLLGANTARRGYVSPESPAIDRQGALLDAYGQPYFFHFISSQKLEIRSAGADGAYYTDDDLVVAD
jgi:hypothetical protein